MEIKKYETKFNGITKLVDALEIEDNSFLCLGEFNNSFGIDYKIGKSLINYKQFDVKKIVESLPESRIRESKELRQFLFDMFMGVIVYLTKDTVIISRMLTEKYIEPSVGNMFVEFFNVIITSQPKTLPLIYDVSVSQFLRNIHIEQRPCEFKGKFPAYNILNLYAYERVSRVRERDWVYMDGVFNNSEPWEKIFVIPKDIENNITGKRIGTLYFTDETLLVSVTMSNRVTYIYYNLPDNLNREVNKFYAYFYIDILDTLLSLADYYSEDVVNNIESYVIIDEVFENYVKSLNNGFISNKFDIAFSAMNK